MKRISQKLLLLALSAVLLLSLLGFSYEKDPENGSLSGYSVNASGQTFGNANQYFALGYWPDLLAAEGVGGLCGYVYLSDLDDNSSSPEEALLANTNKLQYIPLYDSDGKTVIGRFRIG